MPISTQKKASQTSFIQFLTLFVVEIVRVQKSLFVTSLKVSPVIKLMVSFLNFLEQVILFTRFIHLYSNLFGQLMIGLPFSINQSRWNHFREKPVPTTIILHDSIVTSPTLLHGICSLKALSSSTSSTRIVWKWFKSVYQIITSKIRPFSFQILVRPLQFRKVHKV